MSSRAYQLEMLDRSLKQNVIVVVRLQPAQRWLEAPLLTEQPRWTLEAAKLKCKLPLPFWNSMAYRPLLS
jgi:hypothetical protein